MAMKPQASRPDAFDWLAAFLRGFHPLRYLLCLAGLFLTGCSAVAAQALLEQRAPHFLDWWRQPIEHAQALWADIVERSLGGSVLCGGLLWALNAAVWSLIGGWIARHELQARLRGPA